MKPYRTESPRIKCIVQNMKKDFDIGAYETNGSVRHQCSVQSISKTKLRDSSENQCARCCSGLACSLVAILGKTEMAVLANLFRLNLGKLPAPTAVVWSMYGQHQLQAY